MSSQMKHSILNFILWSGVAIFFLLVFFNGDTLENWGDNRTKTLMLAILFGIGFGGQLVLRIVFRKRKNTNTISSDERDDYIQNKAMASSFVLTLIYVFIIAISLYTFYEKNGVVPIAWVWFMAYSLILFANMCTSGFSIYHYYKGVY